MLITCSSGGYPVNLGSEKVIIGLIFAKVIIFRITTLRDDDF